MFVFLTLPLFTALMVYTVWTLTPSGRERVHRLALGESGAWWELPAMWRYHWIARPLSRRVAASDWRWVLWIGVSAVFGLIIGCAFLLVFILIVVQL